MSLQPEMWEHTTPSHAFILELPKWCFFPPTLHHVALFSLHLLSSAHDAAPSQSYHRPAVDFMTYLFVSWPSVILSCHLASLSAYVRLGQRFVGDSKCGLNKPDIAFIMWEMMWQPSDKCCHVSITAAFLTTKTFDFPKYKTKTDELRRCVSLVC